LYFPDIFKHLLNIKFHENPSNWSPGVPFGPTDGWTDMRRIVVTLRNFANSPKIISYGSNWNGFKREEASLRHV